MRQGKSIKLLVLFIICSNISIAQNIDEHKSLFKLGSTPFISKSKINVGISYGINYGSPSSIIQQWTLPNNKKPILFNNINSYISFVNEFEFYVKYVNGYSLAFNYSHIGVDKKNEEFIYGIKWKLVDSDNLIPDGAIEINSISFISISFGSSEENFKYYLTTDWAFYYLPFPYRFSAGVAYSVLKNVNLFCEGNYQSAWEGVTPTQSARTGIDISLFNNIHFDVAIFYMGFKFTDIIPGRNGLTWLNQNYLLTMPEKNNYFLLSSCLNIDLDLLN